MQRETYFLFCATTQISSLFDTSTARDCGKAQKICDYIWQNYQKSKTFSVVFLEILYHCLSFFCISPKQSCLSPHGLSVDPWSQPNKQNWGWLMWARTTEPLGGQQGPQPRSSWLHTLSTQSYFTSPKSISDRLLKSDREVMKKLLQAVYYGSFSQLSNTNLIQERWKDWKPHLQLVTEL